MVQLKKPQDLTSEYKYLLIIFITRKYHVEGDERSKTHPGHGYPEHTDEIDATETYAFVDKNELEAELLKLLEVDKKRKDLLVISIASTIPFKVSLGIQFN